MISYTMVGTKNLHKAAEFFDKVLGVVGAARFIENERMILWGTSPSDPFFAICLPYDGNEATVGNGTMTTFFANSPEQVAEIHKTALEAGGTSEGEPGIRAEKYYMAYFRDLDGNKFAAFHQPA